MFHEYACGCIFSIEQGRVRTCQTHRAAQGDGYGGGPPPKMGKSKRYPANGMFPPEWTGR